MKFIDLMKEIKIMINNWLKDETIIDHYCGNEVEIKREFLKNVQQEIDSNFIILTREELDNINQSYHNSIEGF